MPLEVITLFALVVLGAEVSTTEAGFLNNNFSALSAAKAKLLAPLRLRVCCVVLLVGSNGVVKIP